MPVNRGCRYWAAFLRVRLAALAFGLGLGFGRQDGLEGFHHLAEAGGGVRIVGIEVGMVLPGQQTITPAHLLQSAGGLYP